MRGLLFLVAIGCSSSAGLPAPLGGAREVSGEVIDFQTGASVGGSVTVATTGITPPPTITTEGARYTITEIPEYSVFQILSSAPPTHVPTYSRVIEVVQDDLENVAVPAVKSEYLTALANAFGVTPAATRGVLFVRLVDTAGAPKAGVGNLVFGGGAEQKGPYFLDANLMPAVVAQMTSASGWAVLFEVAPGSVALTSPATVDMPVVPIAAATVTIAQAIVADGGTMRPANVSFRTSVMPIFTNRGCVGCHADAGGGRIVGDLKLDGGPNPTYDELKKKAGRILLENPPASTLLTKPLYESPPNHQNGTFATVQDPDYVYMLVWIEEGAKNN